MFSLENSYKQFPNTVSRSISAENPNGEKAGASKAKLEDAGVPPSEHPCRELGKGWKIRPAIKLKANEENLLADIDGPGIITHIWTTAPNTIYRNAIICIYWDNEEKPSVEVPYGDFFCCGWQMGTKVSSEPICVNPYGGMNSYFPMPFRKHAKITIRYECEKDLPVSFFYQIDYVLRKVDESDLYFHAQWRRENTVEYHKPYTIIDNIKGCGKYVGTYLAWGQNNNGWWGEGELKCYLDGDDENPTICFTGTEDYVGGAWGFCTDKNMTAYDTYSTQYLGYHECIKPDGHYQANTRHGMYRWHIKDPIFFSDSLKVTIQALGWRGVEAEGVPRRLLPLKDDVASVAYWYQSEPHNDFPKMLHKDDREVI